MKLKQLIILVIIVGALAAAGIFAYLSFMGGTKDTLSTTTDKKLGGEILPHGVQLNFDAVKKYNPNGRLFAYPAVTKEETGQQLNEIISQ